jgi:hypothetical protein
MKRTLTILPILTGLWLAGPSARAELLDFKAGAGPFYGTTFSKGEKDGLGVAAYLELGLTETLSVMAGGGYANHFIGDGEAYQLAVADVGIQYAIDVLVVVPFLALRLGWLHRAPEDGAGTSGLGMTFSVGFDYLWTDNFTVGFSAEYHGMLTDFNLFPAYAAFTTRIGFRLED